MGIPGSSTYIEGDGVPNLLWLCLKDSQACQDVVGCIHNEVLDLHVKVQLEIILETELHQDLQCLEELAS